MAPAAKEYPWQYLCASACAAAINYPLWRASAIGQSGFVVQRQLLTSSIPPLFGPYVYAFLPPYKGMIATVLGMTWARAAIFWSSDAGREWMRQQEGCNDVMATVMPPLVASTCVQCINMPVVRATITIQDPSSKLTSVSQAVRVIFQEHGVAGLWHGTSAGILKTVPKYCTAVVVKEFMEEHLPAADPTSVTYESDRLWRSACKSATAGVMGATLTNPLDVIRNEMFKTNLGFTQTVEHLWKELGWKFATRGLGKNMVAVAIPVACTIFFTDAFINFSSVQNHEKSD